MSKFLKVVVNIILLCAIVVAVGLLIPPFAGVTTVVVDDVDMETNLAKGSVTYALDKGSSEFKTGSKVLVYEGDGQYVYEVTAVSGDTYTLEDKLSTDGGTKEMSLGSSAKKVLFTVPFVGYVTMALRTTEGLVIVGLAVVFVIILFILAEIWKKDDEDDDDEEEDDEEEYGEDSEEDDQEPELSRKEQKKAQKAQKKAERAAAKKAAKEEKKARKSRSEDGEEEEDSIAEDVQETSAVPERKTSKEDQQLFDETSTSLAADIANMLGLEQETADDTLGQVKEEIPLPADEQWNVTEQYSSAVQDEKTAEKRIAIPVYTKEELIEKAKAAGEEPDIVEDETSGITFLDYSDIL